VNKEDLEKINNISTEIKDSYVQKEFINKFIAEVDLLLNHYKFDEALKIIPQYDSECTINNKACYLSARVYLVKVIFGKRLCSSMI
jgi:hypothetical protein